MKQSKIFQIYGFILMLIEKPSIALSLNCNKRNHYKITRQVDVLGSSRTEALFASIHPSDFSSRSEDLNEQTDTPQDSWGDVGRVEALKQQEAELARKLAEIRIEKLSALRSKPLTIGVIGFGRFGQFIAKTLCGHGKIIVTSRSNYEDVAAEMGAEYIPLSKPELFLDKNLDVIILATSIVSFDSTVKSLIPHLQDCISRTNKGPLVVDVLSVKEHAREIMLKQLPQECDILCTHPMFGPDSGKNGWNDLTFVYEKTRVDRVVFEPNSNRDFDDAKVGRFTESYSYSESMDRIERFLSIWEEEGCRMVPLSCKAHDEYAANSQFITHLMGRILGAQGLKNTPIDTKGFESVLKLVDSTTADSFDLFYGLYKFNKKNSLSIIHQLQDAMDDVVDNLKALEKAEFQQNKIQLDVQEEMAATSYKKETGI